MRDEIKKTRAILARLEAQRDKQAGLLAGHDKAKAERIAPAAGLSLAEVVALAPAGLAAAQEKPPAVNAPPPAGLDRSGGGIGLLGRLPSLQGEGKRLFSCDALRRSVP
ncbi:hypothetical protein J8N05_18765 [Streptomyces sp. BH-SS-21]|uniref:Uncharacterized protein n=1 Tax=Streptomyces liliiviolaceus TaxID=2823109 RepID=A0A940Y423_9ACTN|nr:hypothetical protein [Streptomyces liliiviolaceus]MBQ0850239.1 hypothetical protein [Streptomyces liliiviolaceus]